MASIKRHTNNLANRRDAAAIKPLFDAINTDGTALVTLANELATDEEAKRNLMDFQMADGVLFGDYTFATQAATTILGAGVVCWQRNGIRRFASIAGNITLEEPTTDTTAQNKYAAWRVVISDLGVVTTQAANASTMQYANAEDALLCLSAIAPTANTVTLGYIVIDADGATGFQIGTDNTNTDTTETMYYERAPRKKATGLTAALGAATAVGTTNTKYSTGTRDYCINGLNVAQDAAEADKAFDDADTIAQGKYGGWLIVTNLAQDATYSLAANGIAGSVSAMSYASSALVDTAIDTIVDNLPPMFCPVSKIVVANNKAGLFTAGTDDIAGTDGTATFTDATVGTWERTSTTGFDSHKITPPSIPAALTASQVTATLES